jgi:hypothetical protein
MRYSNGIAEDALAASASRGKFWTELADGLPHKAKKGGLGQNRLFKRERATAKRRDALLPIPGTILT